MATIDRYVQYPDIASSTIRSAGGQDYVKQHIKQLDTLLLDVGLARSLRGDQLDVDNIADLNINSIFAGNMNEVYWSEGSPNTKAVWYKPIEYMFTDDLQATYPVYIKFEYFYFCPHQWAVTHLATHSPYMGIRITIAAGSKTTAFYQYTPYMAMQYNFSDSNTYNDYYITYPFSTLTTVYPKLNSNVCYNREKGYMFLNLCPEKRYNLYTTRDAYYTNPTMLFSINRISNTSIRLVNCVRTSSIYSGLLYYNSGFTTQSTSRSAYNATVLTFAANINNYSSTTMFQVTNNTSAFIDNGNYKVYKSSNWDGTTSTLTYDDNVLVTNYALVARYGSIINVEMNNEEIKKYFAIHTDQAYGYAHTTNQCLLFYYE